MPDIEKKQIAFNRVVRTSPIRYIVIHDTQNVKKGANADSHFKYFNGGNRNSSADFFVDDTKVLQVNDYTKFCTWQVGDGKGKYGITNQNSIGIEICVNADGDYDKAFASAVELTKYLMAELNIPAEQVVRHYDASRKNCPASMSADSWLMWEKFKEKIMEKKFKDTKGHFAENAIEELYNMGVVNGVSDTEFAPDRAATRGEVAVIARNLIRYITGE